MIEKIVEKTHLEKMSLEEARSIIEEAKKGAITELARKVSSVRQVIKECQKLAKEFGLDFSLDVNGTNTFEGNSGYWTSSSDWC